MTASTLQGIKPQSLVAERDFTFGMELKKEETPRRKRVPEKGRAVDVQTQLLPVRVFYHVLEALRRLTEHSATTSFRNHRAGLAPELHILQDSHKHG